MDLINNENKNYLTPNEVATLLMVAPVTVRSWAQKGLLVAKVTPGGHRRFLKSDVENFMRESGIDQANAKSSASRILIVDDDSLMTTYVHDILEDSGLGFVTEIAQNSFETGVKIHTFSPDVVLINFTRPTIDGFQICSLIKNDKATRHICVIAITENANAENVARILEVGAKTFLGKPFNPQDLLGILSYSASAKQSLPSVSQTDMSNSAKESINAETLLSSLTRMAEAKNSYAGYHNDPKQLVNIATIFGRSLGHLTPEQLLALRNACMLHDIGNLGIPDSILLKPAPLTEEEWTVMRSHTLIGAQLCSAMKDMELTVPIIRSHHERWDGSGYPDGLKGDAIPFLARVFQLVDIFDALSSVRPHKPALSLAEVISIIGEEIVNGWLDPNLGTTFLELIKTRPQDFNVIQKSSDSGEQPA